MANSIPSVNQNIETVIHKLHSAEKPMTLRHALVEAGIHIFGKKRFQDVMDRIRSELFPGGKYADLAGTKLLPATRGKAGAVEAWAKGRNFKSARNPPLPSFEVPFDTAIYLLIEDSDALPEASHRRLAPRIRSALIEIARQPFTKQQMKPLKVFVDAMTAELEMAVVATNGHREAATLAKENAALTQRLLSYSNNSGQPSGEAAHA